MRTTRLILLVSVLALVGASMIWRGLLDAAPALAALPPAPTLRQRQFGSQMGPKAAAALETTLPGDFKPTTPTLGAVLDAMGEAAGITIFFTPPASKAGFPPDTRIELSFANKKLGDA